MLDVGGGPGYFRDAFEAAGATYFALDADVGELSGLGEIATRTVIGSGMQLPFARRVVRRLLLLQRARARRRPVADGRRDAAGHPAAAGWSSSATRSGTGRGAATRPRPGTTSAAACPPALPPQARARAEEQVRRVAVPGHRRGGLRWARRADRGRGPRPDPALQPVVVALAAPRPRLREVVTWNLVIVLRKR